MPRKLTELEVQWISLVDAGANGKAITYKSRSATGDSPTGAPLRTVQVAKADDDKRLVYGIVYAPDQVDSHGDYADAATIERAAHQFLRDLNAQNVDTQHNLQKAAAYVAESWIVNKGDAQFADDPGAWAVVIKVDDDDLWQAIKSGEIGGISLYGRAIPVEEKAAGGFFKRLMALIRKEAPDLEATLEQDEKQDALWKLFWALERTFREIMESDETDKPAAVDAALQQFRDHVSSENLMKAGAVLSAANLKSLTQALDMLQAVLASANKTQEDEMKEDEIKALVDERVAEALKANADGGEPPAGETEQVAALQKQLADQQAQIAALEATISRTKSLPPDNEPPTKVGKHVGGII